VLKGNTSPQKLKLITLRCHSLAKAVRCTDQRTVARHVATGIAIAPPREQQRRTRESVPQIISYCSDIFLIPCWSGEVLSVAFAIDCHDREVFAWTVSPRPLNGGDIRTLMGQDSLGAHRRDRVDDAARDPVTLRQRPAVHRDGLGALRA